MNLVYFDCISGAAGDMLLGALIDAGVPEDVIRSELEGLGIQGWDLRVSTVTKSGLRAVQVSVAVDDDAPERDHAAIRAIIRDASMSEPVRQRALHTFRLLAEAEAKVHDVHPDDVHFHEVGGLDALIDVVGCAAAVEHLRPERIVTSKLVTGRGWTSSSHGSLPVPAPATLEILRGATIEERGEHELITPTGAAILAAASSSFGPMPPLQLNAIGYGAGTADLEWPNVVRVLVGTPVDEPVPEGPWLIETNIDDMSPELIPHSIDALIRAGASDAWTSPILMKKGRPAITLSVLVADDLKEAVLDVLYRETTTLGARLQRVAKDEIGREWIEVSVGGESLRVKLGRRGGSVVTVSPEYDDAARAARATGMSLREVFEQATAEAKRKLDQRV